MGEAVNGAEARPAPPKGVVGRVAGVLATFIESGSAPLSASQIARDTGLSVQTAHRMLGDLAEAGFTMQDTHSKRWTLGPFALGLGGAASKQITLREVARPHLERITEHTEETSVLALRDGLHATYADLVESPHRLALREYVGMRLPLTTGASRLVILAFLADHERHSVIDALHQAGHLDDPDDFELRCTQVREQGYAATRGMITTGAVGLAAPVLVGNSAIASLMLAVPEIRCHEEDEPEFAATLMTEARKLSNVCRSQPEN
ncbi:IclR family transcriptional regulator [Parasphingorhabdus pacifica]